MLPYCMYVCIKVTNVNVSKRLRTTSFMTLQKSGFQRPPGAFNEMVGKSSCRFNSNMKCKGPLYRE